MRLSIELEPHDGQLEHVRRLVSDWAQAVHADQGSMTLIATELVTNAIAASPSCASVVVWLDHEPGEVHVSVVDAGGGLEAGPFEVPPPTAVRGRGLAIVDRLSDRMEVHRADGCTVVTACTRVPVES